MKKLIILFSIFWMTSSFAANPLASPRTSQYINLVPKTNNINTEYLTETTNCANYSYAENTCICEKGYHLSDKKDYCIKSTPATRFDFHLSSLCLYGNNTSHCLKETHELILLRDNPLTYQAYQERLNAFYEIGQRSFECRFPNIFDWKIKDCALDRPLFKEAEQSCRSVYGSKAYYNIYEQRCKYYSGKSLKKKIDTYTTFENTYRFAPYRPEYSKIYYKKERQLGTLYDREFNKYTEPTRAASIPRRLVTGKRAPRWYSASRKSRNRSDTSSLRFASASKATSATTSFSKSTEEVTTLNNSCRLNYGWQAYYKPAARGCYCGKNVCDHRKENLRSRP